MNKKILMLGWGYPPNIDGGLDVHVKHLFEELQKKNIEVDLALPKEKAPKKENIIPIETGEGNMGWKARKMSSKVASLANEYDIIHTHDWFGAEAGFKAKKYSGVKWVSTIHSVSSDRSRKSGGMEDLEKLAVEEPDKLLTVSQRLGDKINREYGREPLVIHNGFSKVETSGKKVREDLGIEENMVFFVGRHAEQKGVEHLIYGFKKYLDSGNDAELVIGGEGYLTESLEDFVDLLNISGNVHFVGFIPDRELGDFYEASDLFVSPSISEPFGLTITEALGAGTPVAATSNGVEEILSSEQIIEIKPDSDSIKEGIKKGLNKGRVEIEDERTWKDMSKEILEVYKGFM